ncbi:glycosyltransferase [Geodermatophilus sp. SYSU D01176]
MATSGAPARRRLLCVAPLVPAGGVDTLLTAFGMLAGDRPELSVDVVGSGPLSRVLRDQATYLGVTERICFRGSLAVPAVRAAVRGCALLVLPHRDDTATGSPTVEAALREALARARPVVATLPAARHAALRDTEPVVPPDVPTALAQALATALAVPEQAPAAPLPQPEPVRHLLRRAWHRVLG